MISTVFLEGADKSNFQQAKPQNSGSSEGSVPLQISQHACTGTAHASLALLSGTLLEAVD